VPNTPCTKRGGQRKAANFPLPDHKNRRVLTSPAVPITHCLQCAEPLSSTYEQASGLCFGCDPNEPLPIEVTEEGLYESVADDSIPFTVTLGGYEALGA
jgi:hypothetical protein